MGSANPARRPTAFVLRVVIAAVVAFGSSIVPERAAAQALYRYVDEDGKVHFVDTPSKVPAARRSQAEEIVPGTPPAPSSPAPSTAPDDGAARESARERVRDERAKPEGSCRLIFRNRKSLVEGTKTIYQGEVVNGGSGTARGVTVDFVDYDESDRVLERRTVTPIPSTLEPRAAGRFSLEMKTVERTAIKNKVGFARTAFEASFVRCD